jgi:hypothetical protein
VGQGGGILKTCTGEDHPAEAELMELDALL